MQAQKEAPLDMQCKDKFLLQSVVTTSGATAKDITAEMVCLCVILVIISIILDLVSFWDFGLNLASLGTLDFNF